MAVPLPPALVKEDGFSGPAAKLYEHTAGPAAGEPPASRVTSCAPVMAAPPPDTLTWFVTCSGALELALTVTVIAGYWPRRSTDRCACN